MKERYILKPMVAARLMGEVVVLGILLALPLILICRGEFFRTNTVTQVIVVFAALVSGVMLPAYGFITYRVDTNDEGISTASLFRRQFAAWNDVRKLTLKTAWGWRRYVVATDDEELNFSVWLMNLPLLVDAIRNRLPNRGFISGPGRKDFKFNLSSNVIEIGKALAGVLFIGIFWMFFASLAKAEPMVGHRNDPTDQVLVLVFCLLASLLLLFRAFLVVLAPKLVCTDQQGLSIVTWFYQKQFPWAEIRSAGPPFFLLPEGVFVQTQRGFFLISSHLEAVDELQEELARHLPNRGSES